MLAQSKICGHINVESMHEQRVRHFGVLVTVTKLYIFFLSTKQLPSERSLDLEHKRKLGTKSPPNISEPLLLEENRSSFVELFCPRSYAYCNKYGRLVTTC